VGKEEVRIYEHDGRRPQPPAQHEEIHITEQTRYRQPEQVPERAPSQFDRLPPQPSHTHIEVKDSTFDSHFNTAHGPATNYAPSQIDVTERQIRERTRPIVAEESRYTKDTFTAKHDPHPEQVQTPARSTVDAPHKRDIGYYDKEGHYHGLRHGLHNVAHKAAHKVAERIAHPLHPHRHHHSHAEHSHVGSHYTDVKEEITVKDKYTPSAPPSHVSAAPAPARSSAPAPAPASVRSYTRSYAPSQTQAFAPAPLPARPVSSGAPAQRVVRVSHAPAPTSASHPSPYVPASPATARKMSSPNTITIPCHHIRIGDLLILQGRPCQVIRITTSSQTGQHRYLGVDLFTKQLHEESSFISNPAPSVIVQNMLGPVFKQYRVLDIREDGRVVAMTESGDVKQGLPVLDQSGLSGRLSESFDNGRGSVRVLVISDDGAEMAVDYKVVHGSRL
jgi:hypothetical protein